LTADSFSGRDTSEVKDTASEEQVHAPTTLHIHQPITAFVAVSSVIADVTRNSARQTRPSLWRSTVGICVQHPVMPDRVKPPFVILTSGHSDAQGWASECPDVKNYKWRLNPVWHRMPYSCTHMATVGRQRTKTVDEIVRVWDVVCPPWTDSNLRVSWVDHCGADDIIVTDKASSWRAPWPHSH